MNQMVKIKQIMRMMLLASALCLAFPACGRKQEVPSETAAAEEAGGASAAETGEEISGEAEGESAEAGGEAPEETGAGSFAEADGETSAETDAESAAEAEGGSPEGADAGSSAETAAETPAEETEPVELTVVKHRQEGTHMVTAGGLTISVPTTFEGLEAEGAVFQGDDVIVTAGKSGSCRVRYKGSFSHIRINVKNNTEYDMAVRDCTVKGIEIGSTEPDPELTLYGIPMGATRQQIADVYGEPFSKTFDDEKGMSNMVYQFGTDIYSNQIVMIIFRDKKAVAASFDDFSLVRR